MSEIHSFKLFNAPKTHACLKKHMTRSRWSRKPRWPCGPAPCATSYRCRLSSLSLHSWILRGDMFLFDPSLLWIYSHFSHPAVNVNVNGCWCSCLCPVAVLQCSCHWTRCNTRRCRHVSSSDCSLLLWWRRPLLRNWVWSQVWRRWTRNTAVSVSDKI